MHYNLLPPCFAGIFGFDFPPYLIAIVVPIAGLVFGGAVAISAMYFKNRKRELWHETARLALEKGQPLPPALDEEDTPSSEQRKDDDRNDFRGGFVLVATGAGLYLFLSTLVGRGLGYVGAIPGFIGVALILHGCLNLMLRSKKSTSDDRAPRS